MTPAVLLLMHQGNSFVRDLHDAVTPKGLAIVAISSQPPSPEVLEKNLPYLADTVLTPGERIERRDVLGSVERFRERGYTIVAALATFEAYRLLMAELNAQIGARDCSYAALQTALDKHALRQLLRREGLSDVDSRLVDAGRLPVLDPNTAWFVKPVRGAGSFGCFVLRDPAELRELPQLQAQMRGDAKMSAIFMDRYDFLVEEFIEGPEFSFETIAAGEVCHICVHEKTRMESRGRTTLEKMSVSPPVSIDADTVARGAEFVTRCLAAAGLTAGAFHIEAKYCTAKRRWEMIEINPRMGGSLINASVQTVTGCSMLALWVESLLASDAEARVLCERLRAVSQLSALREGRATTASLFLTRYGEKGRTIAALDIDFDQRKPDVIKVHVEPGARLADADREIALVDALWRVDYARLAEEVDFLDRFADEHVRVTYVHDESPAERGLVPTGAVTA